MSSNYQEHPEWFTEIMEPFMTPAERAVHQEMIRDAARARVIAECDRLVTQALAPTPTNEGGK